MASVGTGTIITPDDGEVNIPIELHEVGEGFRFTILSFPVLSVRLRPMKFAVIGQDDEEVLIDGFIRDNSSLDSLYECFPLWVNVYEACSVNVSVFILL